MVWPFVVAEDRPTLLDVYVNVKHDGRRDTRQAPSPLPAPTPVRRRDTWSIAEVAEQFGVTHRTVRHYEDLRPDRPRAPRHDAGLPPAGTGRG